MDPGDDIIDVYYRTTSGNVTPTTEFISTTSQRRKQNLQRQASINYAQEANNRWGFNYQACNSSLTIIGSFYYEHVFEASPTKQSSVYVA